MAVEFRVCGVEVRTSQEVLSLITLSSIECFDVFGRVRKLIKHSLLDLCLAQYSHLSNSWHIDTYRYIASRADSQVYPQPFPFFAPQRPQSSRNSPKPIDHLMYSDDPLPKNMS
jgi:hypothetical protein